MPPKTRTTAARKPAARARKPKPTEIPPGVLVLDRPENVDAFAKMLAEREPLFAIDGVVYTIPKNVPPAWSMTAIDLAMTQGENVALAWVVGKMLEPEAYEALKNCPTLLPGDLSALFRIIMDKVLPDGAFAPKAS
jgi:hypothetical protein